MKKKQTKQRIKDIILKVVNIIGYVCIGLIVVLGILTGVNSCKNSRDQNVKTIKRNDINEVIANVDINNNNYVYYYNRFSAVSYGSGTVSYEITLEQQANLIDLCGGAPLPGNDHATGQDFLSFGFGAGVLPTVNLYFYPQVGNLYLLNDDGRLVRLSRLYLEFIGLPSESGSSLYYYRLASVRSTVASDNVLGLSGNFRVIARNYASYANVYNDFRSFYGSYDTTILRQYFVAEVGATLPPWFDFWYRTMYGSFNITLNTFNPNGAYGYSANTVVVRNDRFNPVDGEYTKYDSVHTWASYGFLYSNNRFFTSIHIYWQRLSGGRAYQDPSVSRGYSFTQDNTDGWGYFSSMEYWNDYTNEKVVVCRRLDTNIDGITMPSTTIQWFDTGYQSLSIYDVDKFHYEQNTQDFTNMNQNNLQEDIGFDNPFWLISMMFNSITPFFNIQILPYMSIGLLLAIPLIFLIVSAIISIIKK